MATLSFQATPEEHELAEQIATRAMPMAREAGDGKVQKRDIVMDLIAVHANGCPLKLAALLKADDFNFAHDVFGIRRHLNRTTGKLRGCFLPRFARRTA